MADLPEGFQPEEEQIPEGFLSDEDIAQIGIEAPQQLTARTLRILQAGAPGSEMGRQQAMFGRIPPAPTERAPTIPGTVPEGGVSPIQGIARVGGEALRTVGQVINPMTYLPEEEVPKPFVISPEGIRQMTTREARARSPLYTPDVPLLPVRGTQLEPTGSDAARQIASLSTLDNIALMATGAESQVVGLAMLADMAPQAYSAVRNIARSDIAPEEKRDQINALVMPLAIGLRHMKPESAETTVTPKPFPGIRTTELPPEQPVAGATVPITQAAPSPVPSPPALPIELQRAAEKGLKDADADSKKWLENQQAIASADTPPEQKMTLWQANEDIKNKYKEEQAPTPLKPDNLRTAVEVEGKNLVGEPGETHSDVLERHGIDPSTIPHSDKRRGFVDINNPDILINRIDAEKRSGLKGTADAGGLDSMDLPNAARLRLEREMAKEGQVSEVPRATTADILGKVSQRLDSAAEAARSRLAAQRQKGVGGQFNLGPLGELENIRDFAIIGAAKIAKGATEFARWSAEMVKEFGERITPHLERIFRAAQDAFDEHASVVTRVNRVLYEAGLPRRAVAEAGKKAVGKSIEAGVEAGKSLAEAEAAPKLASLQEQLSDSISKAQALREYFRGQEEGGAAGRKAATEELKLADKWLEADARRIRESLIAFANASLPVSERGRFLKAITDATKRPPLVKGDPEAMYRRAALVAARIEDRATDVRKAGVATEIKEAVSKAISSPGVDIGYKKRILDAVRRIAFTKPMQATVDALKATRDYLAGQEAAGKDVEMPKAVLDELEVLGKVPVKELPEHILEAIRDRVNFLDQLGRLKVKARKQAWEIEKNNKIRELNQQRTNPIRERPEFRQQPGDPRPLSMKLRNWLNRQLNMGALLDKALLPIDALFDLLGDAKGTYQGWLFKNVRNPLDLGFNAAQVMRDRLTSPLEKIIKDNNLGERESERIGVYAAALQEGGIERLVEMGVKPETIDNILKTSTPAEMNAYRAMRLAMDSTLPDVQKLMHELYNIDVKPVLDYFPMPRDWNLYESEPKAPAEPTYGQPIDFDELSGWKQMLGDFSSPRTTKTERGFTITREKGAATPIKLNAFDVFFQHMNDVAYLLKTQRDIKMIGEIARGDMFNQKYGDVGQNIVLSWLDTVARQGKLGGFRRIPMLDELRKRTSAGVIGFRLASQFVHLSNVPLAVWRAGGPLWYRSGLGEAFSERGQNFLKDNFAETFARGGGEPALVEAAQSDLSVFGKRLIPKQLVRASFAIARKIDQYNAQATTLAIYLRLLHEKGLDAKNYDKIPVDKDAQAQALVLSRRAVASPLPKDVSASLARGALTGGNISLGRTIFQFQNIFQDQWSNIRHDLARAGIREKNPKLAATAFVALIAMLLSEMGIREASRQAISGLTGYKPKKEPSEESRIALEAARRIPFGGQISSQIMYGETGVPILDSAVDVSKAIKQAATAKKEATQVKALTRGIAGAAQLGGVPGASQVGEIIEKAQ